MTEKPTYEELEKRIQKLKLVEVEYSRLQKRFQESEENKITVQEVMNKIPGFAFIKDRNLIYMNANHTFCDLLKIPYDQIHGKTDYDIFPADLAKKYIADDKKVIESGEPLFIEEETSDMNKDGRRFIVATRKHPWFNEKGQIIGIYGLGFDISELKWAEEALRESEEKYHNLFHNASLGIFHSTVDDKFINMNPALAKMLGYDSPEEAIRLISSISKQVYVDTPLRDTTITKATESGDVINVENRYRRRDGAHWYGMLYLRIVRDQQGRPCYNEGFVEDITKRRQVEQEREALVLKLQKALHDVKRLSGLLPICMHCKKIRDDKGYWNQIEEYIHDHSDAEFSHCICQECADKYYSDLDL